MSHYLSYPKYKEGIYKKEYPGTEEYLASITSKSLFDKSNTLNWVDLSRVGIEATVVPKALMHFEPRYINVRNTEPNRTQEQFEQLLESTGVKFNKVSSADGLDYIADHDIPSIIKLSEVFDAPIRPHNTIDILLFSVRDDLLMTGKANELGLIASVKGKSNSTQDPSELIEIATSGGGLNISFANKNGANAWSVKDGWQTADLEDGRFVNHKRFDTASLALQHISTKISANENNSLSAPSVA